MKESKKKQDAQVKELGREQADLTVALDAPGGARNSRHSFYAPYLSALWKLAKAELYPQVHLTRSQCEIALKLLEKWYEPIPEDRIEKVHEVYCARIAMVKKYLNADLQNRYVQLPYLYFDPQNASGFAGTKKWYERQSMQQRKRSSSRILFQQIERFKRNERYDTAISQPRLPLFRECERRVKKLQQPELLQTFYKAIVTDKKCNKF